MKTDKLLQLISQKNPKRDAGRLPLPRIQTGSSIEPYVTTNPNDPRIKAYADSLSLYKENFNQLKAEKENNANIRFITRVPFTEIPGIAYASDFFEKNGKESLLSRDEVYPEKIKPIYFDINQVDGHTQHSAYYKKPVQKVELDKSIAPIPSIGFDRGRTEGELQNVAPNKPYGKPQEYMGPSGQWGPIPQHLQNGNNWRQSVKKQGGALIKAQKGTEKLPSGYITYGTNPEYFNNRAVYNDNADYNDLIRKSVYAGTHAFNPETGELMKLQNQVAVPKANKQMATRDYTEGVRIDPTNPYYAGADERTKQLIQQSTNQTYQNPLMYAPGMIGLAGLPETFGMGYGFTQAAANVGQGNYKQAALDATLSALPILPHTIKNSVLPYALQSDMTKKILGETLTSDMVAKNINPKNWMKYNPQYLDRGSFGHVYSLNKFPNILIKKSASDKVASVIGNHFDKYRFENIPAPINGEYPKYYSSFIEQNDPFIPKENGDTKYNWEVMSRVSGVPFKQLSTKQINLIPKESWEDLMNTLSTLTKNDIGFDRAGMGNLRYDFNKNKFSIIDLTPGASQSKQSWRENILGNLSKPMSDEETRNAIKEIISDKVYENFDLIESRIGRRPMFNTINNSDFTTPRINLKKSLPTENEKFHIIQKNLANKRDNIINMINSIKQTGGTFRVRIKKSK
jgi:hypothetical protein